MEGEYDVLIVTDSTASMTTYLAALNSSIPEILALGALTGSFRRFGVLAYVDYNITGRDVVEFSGWDRPDLAKFAAQLKPVGNNDTPEAGKTGLNEVLKLVDPAHKTIVLWYADAPPHHASQRGGYYSNRPDELRALGKDRSDWIKLSYEAKDKNCVVFSFVPENMDKEEVCFWTVLSDITGGKCFGSSTRSSGTISRLTIDILMSWMGQDVQYDRKSYNAYNFCFDKSPLEVEPQPVDEESGNRGFLPLNHSQSVSRRLDRKPIEDFLFIPRWSVSTFVEPGKRYASSDVYKRIAISSLGQIISSNVYSLTYNSIFGQVWRAVAKDRSQPGRDELVDQFSQKISSVTDPVQKEELKVWLEASYDSSAEIQEAIDAAPPGERMYLDLDAEVELTRTELLEVSRSCYSGVLKKLATIFTHLKLVEPHVVLRPQQRAVPLSLPPNKVFQLLPHLVVSGTLFSQRAASLMAALALIVGVPFLMKPATAVLQKQKGHWINVDIPENLSYECGKLLLGVPEGVALTAEEEELYRGMRRYRLIELNYESVITARVPWTPEKTRGVGDRKVVCENCKIKRSTTMMSEDMPGYCGICAETGLMKPEDYPDRGEMESCWVQCSVPTCLAHYVIENVAGLRVRPKCYYCRTNKPCPRQECSRCRNQIIVPTAYRSSATFVCPGCESSNEKLPTIVDEETTTKALVAENSVAWLGVTSNKDRFLNRSGFKLFQAHGAEFFKYQTPDLSTISLRSNAKPVLNVPEVLAQIERRVKGGQVELGTCTLCFEDHPYEKLVPACGRTGCKQRVDERCLQTWYGRNEPGKLLNLMQLVCPFDRRKPTLKILRRFNPRAAALGGLQTALEDRRWYYAWCIGCGQAKPAVERACCDGERVPNIVDFFCEECTSERQRERERVEREAQELRERLARAEDEAQRRRLEQLETTAQMLRVAGDEAVRITPCPQCGVMVQKTFGCNHIECTCGTHFCHTCGGAFDEYAIYDHMTEAHGSIYDDDDDEDE